MRNLLLSLLLLLPIAAMADVQSEIDATLDVEGLMLVSQISGANYTHGSKGVLTDDYTKNANVVALDDANDEIDIKHPGFYIFRWEHSVNFPQTGNLCIEVRLWDTTGSGYVADQFYSLIGESSMAAAGSANTEDGGSVTGLAWVNLTPADVPNTYQFLIVKGSGCDMPATNYFVGTSSRVEIVKE